MKKKSDKTMRNSDFESLVSVILQIHHQTRKFATKAVNMGLTLRNWLIGRQIMEYEQEGQDRATYGEGLIDALANRLMAAGLSRVDTRELRRFRQFYSVYPQIRESLSPELLTMDAVLPLLPFLHGILPPKRETLSPESEIVETASPPFAPAQPELLHRLSFSHFAELIELPDETQRRFYEIECIRGNWSVRELRRQIASLYYERSGLSNDKAKLSALAHAGAETLQPAQIIRDPYVFEFLGLRSRDVMGESDLEDAVPPPGAAGLRTRISNTPQQGWYSRGYLPHFNSNDVIQHVTFHLADSLPKKTVERLLAKIQQLDPEHRDIEKRRRLETLIDAGHGACWLRRPACARIVQDALLHFDGERYRMIAWVVMPNHVHALFQTMQGWSMNAVVGSWKTFTANAIGRIVSQPDAAAPHVWHPEFWDRFIRDQKHFVSARAYIHNNPVKAGLVSHPEDWHWSSATSEQTPGSAGQPPGSAGQTPGSAGLRTRTSNASAKPHNPRKGKK